MTEDARETPGEQIGLGAALDQDTETESQRDFVTVTAGVLAIAFLVIAAIGILLGLFRDPFLSAVDNRLELFIGAGALTLVAIAFEVASLSLRPNRKFWKAANLILGVLTFLTALTLSIWGVASAGTGNGRPSLTELSVEPGSATKLSFNVHADGVGEGKIIIVEVDGYQGMSPIQENPLFQTLLHSDRGGNVDQRVSFVFDPKKATRVTVRARPDHVGKDGDDCNASEASASLGCATVVLPGPS